jgi:hypothetical protein
MSAAMRKWYRLVPVMFLGVLLLGSMLAPPPPALAQISNTLQDNIPGSLLVFPIFDVITTAPTGGPNPGGPNQTKIRITNNGVTTVLVRITYVCQPQTSSTSSAVCPSFDETFPITHNQTIVLDVGTEVFGACPTGQGYIVAWAEAQCPLSAVCVTPGGTIPPGAFGAISYNQLYGSYHLYYHGAGNSPALLCGGVPCSPPFVPTAPNPDVEAANAIAIQSLQPAFSFLGNDTNGALSLTFGTTTAFDYVALPRTVQTDFAAPGAQLFAGPSDFTPGINPDTSSGTELQTNVILLNLNYSQFAFNAAAAMSVNAWNWHEVGFTTTHRFICWERIPIDRIDPRINLIPTPGPFGENYGNIRFTPSPSSGASSPQLLGALEEVSFPAGRTIRNFIHSATAASPAVFITDIER